jgi:hypothetical protein
MDEDEEMTSDASVRGNALCLTKKSSKMMPVRMLPFHALVAIIFGSLQLNIKGLKVCRRLLAHSRSAAPLRARAISGYFVFPSSS